LAVLLAPVASTAARAGAAPKPVLHFESGTNGEIGLDAREVTLEQVLLAIAGKGGFEVVIEDGVDRPLVNLTVPMAPLEDVLREILRGRNYAFVRDADTASLSRVIVLAPSAARKPGAVYRQRRGISGSRGAVRR